VKFRAEYAPDKEAVVWATGSGLRDDVKGPGAFIFSPTRLPTGETVVVNRGFVADQKPSGSTKRPPPVLGQAEITGIMRWPEPKGWELSTPYDRGSQLWFVRDHLAIAQENGWDRAAPFYIEREAQEPPDSLPPPGRLNANLPNNHLQYALTWYGLAVVLVAVFGFWVHSRWRGRPAPSL
jgi:surfeit locus 1 family protein